MEFLLNLGNALNPIVFVLVLSLIGLLLWWGRDINEEFQGMEGVKPSFKEWMLIIYMSISLVGIPVFAGACFPDSTEAYDLREQELYGDRGDGGITQDLAAVYHRRGICIPCIILLLPGAACALYIWVYNGKSG